MQEISHVKSIFHTASLVYNIEHIWRIVDVGCVEDVHEVQVFVSEALISWEKEDRK